MKLQERINPYAPERARATKSEIDRYLLERQKVNSMLNPYSAIIDVYLSDENLPFKQTDVGDSHAGHVEAKVYGLERAVKETGKGLLVTHANLMDSVSGKFINTNTTKVGLNADQQEGYVKEILRPVDENGQLAPIGKNTCHEGWLEKTATHDPLPKLVSPTTRLLYTGGQIHYHLNGERVANVEVYHNPGKGRTQLSPEGSERARSREVPFGHPDRPDAVIGAHMHQLTAAQDVVRSPIDRKDHVTALGQVGTAKGTRDNPDEFLVGLGVPPRSQPADAGEGFVMILKKNSQGKVVSYPVAGYDRANRMFEAERLWENAQRTGTMNELREQLLANKQLCTTDIEKNEKESLKRFPDKGAKSEGIAPLHKTISYNINTRLPIRLNFLGNPRVGSTSFERKKINTILKDINSNAWAYCLATRRLINQGTAQSPDRLEVLEDMANVFGGAKDSLLGVMLTDELRSKAWTHSIKTRSPKAGDMEDMEDIEDKKDIAENKKGIYPGDYLYFESKIKGVPLIMPETVISLKLKSQKKETPYTIYLRDKLSNFTSLINPEHGLTRIEQLWGIDADVLVGGCTEIVGWRTWMRPWGQLEVVVPGGFAEYVEKGIGSRVDYPTGGQGVILFPGEKNVYSFATYEDGKDMHQALWLREGYAQLGLLPDLMKKLDKKD